MRRSRPLSPTNQAAEDVKYPARKVEVERVSCGVNAEPVLSVIAQNPFSPAIKTFELKKEIIVVIAPAVSTGALVQIVPASVVIRRVPPVPATQTVFPFMNLKTSQSETAGTEMAAQDTPPSVVRATNPLVPATHP